LQPEGFLFCARGRTLTASPVTPRHQSAID
jgi:hypothetical protein